MSFQALTKKTTSPLHVHTKSGGSEPLGQLIFIHGSLDDSSSFRRMIDLLPQWDIIAYDRRGWGQSKKSDPGSYQDHIDDLIGLLPENGKSILIGHSFGGTIALSAAHQAPDRLRAVVVYEPPLPWLPWWPDRAPWERIVLDEGRNSSEAAEALMRAVLGDKNWEKIPAPIKEKRKSDGDSLVIEMRSLCENAPDFDPLTIDCPVISLAGSNSLIHHQIVSQKLAELVIRGHYRELPDAEHPAHVTHPREFAQLIQLAGELSN